MPEGPEIRLAADKVARVLLGHDIVQVEFHLARLRRFENRLKGSAVAAVDTRGVTTTTKQVKERKALGMSYQQYRFQVFGRGGLDCYACGTKIERHTMASRNLFVCPGCQ